MKSAVLFNGEPVTLIGYVPGRVEAKVDIVKVGLGLQVGLHGAFEKFAVAPVGNPEADRLTCCVVPPVKLRLIAVWPEFPWVTVMFAGLAML